ncbi:unnamed protein product [Bursaphelenchus xylophilus]|uniref:(pine wood nematode) hypothetical protein n=1 Tax=Bursaphelenchus xylophilus TaxID=6326 RepID=A0A1I7RHA8_BURXY|nr:unnamed protein product [Bursaphelenchus xylophilus]CAG9115888.1 unnamed protein product [Bursaphelenchus xylophilus]
MASSGGNPAKSRGEKRKASEEEESSTSVISEGLHFTKVKELGMEYNEGAYSLHEIINAIQPKRSIHFNFCVEFDFMFKSYPKHLRHTPIAVISGSEQDVEDGKYLKKHFPHLQVQCAATLSKWGHHHTKLSLFETDSGLHVVISTANMTAFDWGHLTQGFYYAHGEFLKTENAPVLKRSKKADGFGDDLKKYLRAAYLNPGLKILSAVEHWSDLFAKNLPDFSHIKDRLVYTIPGKEWLQPMGHTIMRNILKSHLSDEEIGDCTFIGQVSSIGSLGQNKDEWVFKELAASMCGKDKVPKDLKFKLVYPSMKTMAESVDGWLSGGAFPWDDNVYWRQKWMDKYFCDWRSDKLGRTRCMPHIKSYAAVTSDGSVKWLLITSANLSKAAWGRLNRDGRSYSSHSYELGVLMLADNYDQPLELPFDWPLTEYSKTDSPFRRNTTTSLKDCEGREYPFTS